MVSDGYVIALTSYPPKAAMEISSGIFFPFSRRYLISPRAILSVAHTIAVGLYFKTSSPASYALSKEKSVSTKLILHSFSKTLQNPFFLRIPTSLSLSLTPKNTISLCPCSFIYVPKIFPIFSSSKTK